MYNCKTLTDHVPFVLRYSQSNQKCKVKWCKYRYYHHQYSSMDIKTCN